MFHGKHRPRDTSISDALRGTGFRGTATDSPSSTTRSPFYITHFRTLRGRSEGYEGPISAVSAWSEISTASVGSQPSCHSDGSVGRCADTHGQSAERAPSLCAPVPRHPVSGVARPSGGVRVRSVRDRPGSTSGSRSGLSRPTPLTRLACLASIRPNPPRPASLAKAGFVGSARLTRACAASASPAFAEAPAAPCAHHLRPPP
jgi:hypothetical protein